MIAPFPALPCGCPSGFWTFHGLCNTHPNAMFTAAELRVGEAYWDEIQKGSNDAR